MIGEATRSALSQARARWASRDGSPIRVIGSPDGASITIDHNAVGAIPYEGTLSPGTHHFVVAALGRVTERRNVEVAAASTPVAITFELAVGSDAVTTPSGGGPDVAPVVIGSIVALAGVPLLIDGAYGLAFSTSCDASGVCTRSNVPIDAALVSAGAALLIGGVIVLALGAATHSTSPSRARFDARSMSLFF